MDLRNKGAIVTGASEGLGRALAERLAKAGARVVLVARREGPLEAAVAAIRADGGDAHGIAADVGARGSAATIAGAAAAMIGAVDVLIHNASTLGPVPLRPLAETDAEDFERVLDVNLTGSFRLTQALLGAMLNRGSGTIVHVSSDAAVEAYPTWGAYGVSKAALDHLSRVWAAELEGTGARFLAVDPGEMDTAMHADAMPDADRASLARPADVAARIVRLIETPTLAKSGARVSADAISVDATSVAS